jgi:hypothetical protein
MVSTKKASTPPERSFVWAAFPSREKTDDPQASLTASRSEPTCETDRRSGDGSGGIQSEAARDCRDAFLGLGKTCHKLGIAFWDYLGARLGVPDSPRVPHLADLVRCRGQPA